MICHNTVVTSVLYVLDIFPLPPINMSNLGTVGSNNRPSGRKRPHERDTNDITPTLGSDLPLPDDLLQVFNDTKRHYE